jgi:hypothetical protein
LRPNVAEAWTDTLVLGLGKNQIGIDDPVSSALRSLERVPDEKLRSDWPATGPGFGGAFSGTEALPAASDPRLELAALTEGRPGFSTVSEPKGMLSLSTSSSSSAPSAPIEVLQFRESEPPKSPERRAPWSVLDALVVGVAVVTVALSALALAWFLAS